MGRIGVRHTLPCGRSARGGRANEAGHKGHAPCDPIYVNRQIHRQKVAAWSSGAEGGGRKRPLTGVGLPLGEKNVFWN